MTLEEGAERVTTSVHAVVGRRRGRPKRDPVTILRDDETPSAMRNLARRRMRGFARHWGAQPDLMTLEDLCASCYLQGLRDAIDAQDSTANAQGHVLTRSEAE